MKKSTDMITHLYLRGIPRFDSINPEFKNISPEKSISKVFENLFFQKNNLNINNYNLNIKYKPILSKFINLELRDYLFNFLNHIKIIFYHSKNR